MNKSKKGVLATRHAEQDLFLITAAGSNFQTIEDQGLCLVNLAGEFVKDVLVNELPPNLNFYLKVFEDRRDVAVLAHLFPPFTSIFADQAQLFELSENPTASPVRELIRVECRECPSRFTGLCSCRSDIRKSYAGADALLIKREGIVVLAENADALFLKVAWLERSAKKAYRLTL